MEPEKQFAEIISLIQQIRNEVVSRGKYFELGDEPGPINSIEGAFNKIQGILESLNNYYLSKPLHDSNPFLTAERVVHRTQDFIKEIRIKGGGSTGNTSRILALLDELDKLITQLNGKRKLEAPPENTSNHDNENIHTGSASRAGYQVFKPNNPVNLSPTLGQLPQLGLSTLQPTTMKSVETPTEKSFLPWQIIHFVFVSIPGAIGRVPLDLFGKGKDAAESTPVLLGYAIIVVAILVLLGVLGLNAVRDWFVGWWMFFNPVK